MAHRGRHPFSILFYPKVCNPWAPMEHIPLAFLFPTKICDYHFAVSRYLLEVNRSQNLPTLQSKARDRWGVNSQGKTSNLCRSEIGVDKPPSPLVGREGRHPTGRTSGVNIQAQQVKQSKQANKAASKQNEIPANKSQERRDKIYAPALSNLGPVEQQRILCGTFRFFLIFGPVGQNFGFSK